MHGIWKPHYLINIKGNNLYHNLTLCSVLQDQFVIDSRRVTAEGVVAEVTAKGVCRLK